MQLELREVRVEAIRARHRLLHRNASVTKGAQLVAEKSDKNNNRYRNAQKQKQN